MLASRFSLAITTGILVALLGVGAVALQAPLLAPPLGVTAFAVMIAPDASESQPRTIVLGHLVGLVAGGLALFVCGELGTTSALTRFSLGHALAAGLAITSTIEVSARLRATHPPALATTLVASLGLLGSLVDGLALWLGAWFLAGLASLRNRQRARLP